MESKEIRLVVTEDMYLIIADALLENLLRAEKIADHSKPCEFTLSNVNNAAFMFHSFTSAFDGLFE